MSTKTKVHELIMIGLEFFFLISFVDLSRLLILILDKKERLLQYFSAKIANQQTNIAIKRTFHVE